MKCLSICALIWSLSAAVAGGQPTGGPQHVARRAALLKSLGARVAIVPSQDAFKSDDQLPFKQSTDFYYFTGMGDLVGAVLALDGVDGSSVLFMPAVSPVLSRPRLALGTAGAQAAQVTAVVSVDSLEGWLKARTSRAQILVSPNDRRGAVRLPVPMAGGVVRWAHYLRTLGYAGDVASATPFTRVLRQIKEPAEVETLTRVAKLTGEAMLEGMRALGPGVPQRVVEGEVVEACIAGGGMHSFWPWAMSGPRGVFTDLFNSFVDYDAHNRTMRRGELVRVDVGCALDQYMGDVGRTAPVTGRFTPGQREAWDLFIAGYKAGLAQVRHGVQVKDLFDVIRDRVRQLAPMMKTTLGKAAAEELLTARGSEAWQFHNVGLDDAEGAPTELKTGMVVAYEIMYAVGEAHFYLEDMILVEPNGARVLSAGLPYTSAEIERSMGPRRGRP